MGRGHGRGDHAPEERRGGREVELIIGITSASLTASMSSLRADCREVAGATREQLAIAVATASRSAVHGFIVRRERRNRLRCMRGRVGVGGAGTGKAHPLARSWPSITSRLATLDQAVELISRQVERASDLVSILGTTSQSSGRDRGTWTTQACAVRREHGGASGVVLDGAAARLTFPVEGRCCRGCQCRRLVCRRGSE